MTRFNRRWRQPVLLAALAFACGSATAGATPAVVIDAATGDIFHQEQATVSWFPASLTKLMTAYVALKAVQDKRITLDTPIVVSMRAERAAPSKMGFRPGTLVTLDNALKMLMVKSANDIAVTIAEGVSGSVEAFSGEMNATAQKLGMHESYFDNPNGLPDEQQVSSARDLAVLARALYNDFPDKHDLFGIGELQLGNQIIHTHNGLLGRYAGADGMKTGFTCAAGFNIVVSATRGSRHLIAVVLGSSTVRERNQEAADLLEAAFSGATSPSGSIDSLPPAGVQAAPNMRGDVCERHARAESMGEESEEPAQAMLDPAQRQMLGRAFVTPAAATPGAPTEVVLSAERPHFDPVQVYVGPAPGWNGPIANAAAAPPATTAYAPSKLEGSDAANAAAAAAGPAKLSRAAELMAPVKGRVVKKPPKPHVARRHYRHHAIVSR